MRNGATALGTQVARWCYDYRTGGYPGVILAVFLHAEPHSRCSNCSTDTHRAPDHSFSTCLFPTLQAECSSNRTEQCRSPFSKPHSILILKNKLLTWAACSAGSGSLCCPLGSTLQLSFLASIHHHYKALAHSIPSFLRASSPLCLGLFSSPTNLALDKTSIS